LGIGYWALGIRVHVKSGMKGLRIVMREREELNVECRITNNE
jgi:hypothetical protein